MVMYIVTIIPFELQYTFYNFVYASVNNFMLEYDISLSNLLYTIIESYTSQDIPTYDQTL